MKIQSLNNRKLEQFLKLYNPAKSKSFKAFQELYIKLTRTNNQVIICNLVNVLNIGKNAVSRRLIKSILSKMLNNKVK